MNVQEREGDKREKVEKKDTHTFYHSTKRLHTASCCILFQSLFFHFFFFFFWLMFLEILSSTLYMIFVSCYSNLIL